MEEEARARAVLAEMQMRISQGPHAALSIPETAGPDEVRTAFLQLTKQFHPARFGRMSGEIHRLANEVFLGIKSAHDQLMKMLLGASGRIPQVRRAATPPIDNANPGGTVRGTGLQPSRIGSQPAGTQPIARGTLPIDPGTQRGGTDRGVGRPGTPNPTPAAGTPRPPTSQSITTPMPRVTPPAGIPIQRPSAPAIDPPTNRPRTGESQPVARQSSSHLDPPTNRPRTGESPALQRNTPPAGVPVQRPGSPPVPARPASPPVINPPTIRYGSPQPTQPLPRTGVSDEQLELQSALDRLNTKDWTGARLQLHALAAKVPQSKHYRALLCYARGRETQAMGRVDDALMEFQRALQLEPELEVAKQAIRELQRKSRL